MFTFASPWRSNTTRISGFNVVHVAIGQHVMQNDAASINQAERIRLILDISSALSVPERPNYCVWCGARIAICDGSSCSEAPSDAPPPKPTTRRHGDRYLVRVPKPSTRAARITTGADMSAEVGANGCADMGANMGTNGAAAMGADMGTTGGDMGARMGKVGGVIGAKRGTVVRTATTTVTTSTTTITTVTMPIGARPMPRTTDAIATAPIGARKRPRKMDGDNQARHVNIDCSLVDEDLPPLVVKAIAKPTTKTYLNKQDQDQRKHARFKMNRTRAEA